jgi:endonuclease I
MKEITWIEYHCKCGACKCVPAYRKDAQKRIDEWKEQHRKECKRGTINGTDTYDLRSTR